MKRHPESHSCYFPLEESEDTGEGDNPYKLYYRDLNQAFQLIFPPCNLSYVLRDCRCNGNEADYCCGTSRICTTYFLHVRNCAMDNNNCEEDL